MRPTGLRPRPQMARPRTRPEVLRYVNEAKRLEAKATDDKTKTRRLEGC